MVSDNALVFYHIPKTAGMSFQAVLSHHFDPMCVQKLVVNSDQQRDEQFNHTRVRARHETYTCFFGPEKQLLCAMGHEAFYSCFWTDRPCIYITLLRNPVDRIVSQFHYVKKKQSAGQRQIVLEDRSVNEVFESESFWNSYMVPNDYIRHAIWYHWYSDFYCRALSPYGHFMTILEGKEEEAKGRCAEINFWDVMTHYPLVDNEMYLESLNVVKNREIKVKHPTTGEVRVCPIYIGIAEQLNDFVNFLRKELSIRFALPTPRTNAGTYNKQELSQKAIKKLVAHNQYDIELYKLAKDHFEEMVS